MPPSTKATNPGNFANNPERATECGKKGGQAPHKRGFTSPTQAQLAGRKGGLSKRNLPPKYMVKEEDGKFAIYYSNGRLAQSHKYKGYGDASTECQRLNNLAKDSTERELTIGSALTYTDN